MKKMILLLVTLVLLSACAPDPRKEADAYKTRMEADAAKQLADANLQHTQEMDAIALQNAQREQAIKDAALEESKAAAKRFVNVFSWVSLICLCVVVAFLAYNVSTGMRGIRDATVQAATIKANLIYLDEKTGTYPLLMQKIHGDRYAMRDPNDGSVTILDVPKEADAQKIAVDGQVRATYILAKFAKESNSPAGMSQISPQIVSAKDTVITIGSEDNDAAAAPEL